MKLPFNKLCRGRSDFALRNSSSYYRRLPLEPLEERRLLAAGEFLGPNLVFNGSFDEDEGGSDDLTGWLTANDGVQWEIEGGDGVARVTSRHSGSPIDPNLPTGEVAAKIRQGVLVSPNTTYRLEFDINTRQATTAISSTDIKLQVFEGDPNDSVSFLFDRVYRDIDNGRQFVEIVTGANVDDNTITFQFIANKSNRDFTIDNVLMRELIDVPIDGGLGPEILINGTFDQADQLSSWEFANGGVDWVLESSSRDDGAARITSVNTDPDVPPGTIAAKIRQGFSTEPETTYQLEFDLVTRQLSGQTRSDVKLQLFKGSQANSFWFEQVFSRSANIHYVVPFTTEAGDDAITVQFIASRFPRSFTIDNVSVRETISIPREVGVELLANGSFDTAGGGFDSLAGWTASGDPGTVTWDNGAARVNRTSGNPSIEQSVRTVKNAAHLVSFELNVAAGLANVQVLNGTGGILANDVLGSGQHSFEVTSVDKILTIRAQTNAGGNFTIDDVSIQITELPPDPNIGNFIVNGSFDVDGGGSNNLSGWEFPNGGVQWELDGPPFRPQIIPDDGVARITSVHPGTLIDPNTPDGAATAKIRQIVQVKTNTTYRLEFDIISRLVVTEISTTTVKLQVFRAGTTSPLLLAVTLDKNDNGHQAFDLFTEGENDITVQFVATKTAQDFTIDNVTLREIAPKLVDVSSFEVGEGFSEGLLDGQAGWTSMVDPGEGPISPFISRDNPNSGSQHVRIEKNFALPVADSDNPGPFNGAISGEIPDVTGGVFATSIDVFISDRNGADYDVVAQASSQNDVTWQIRFESNGTIRAADDLGRGRELVDTGASWTPGVYRTLQVVVDSAKNRISYEYNGTEIYSTSGNGGVFGADVVEEIILKSNNAHIGDFADFDNLTITNLSGGEPEKSDLARAVPTGWDDTIVLSTEAGTNSDASIIEPGQDIFVDLAMSNIGLADTGEFSVQLMIDGAPFGNPQVVVGPLSPLGTATFEDINIGPRSAGDHTISLVIDFLDGVPDGNVEESDETNNTYARVFTVGTTDEVGSIAAAPFNRVGVLGGLISVSEGTSGRINTAGDSDDVSFAGQVGETIAAMVTPTSSTARLTIQLVGAAGTFTGAPGASVVLPPRAVTSTGVHRLRISGTAATDYVVKLVRNAAIEGTDSGNGSELSLGGSSTVAGSAVLAMTHSGADVDEFTIDLTGKTGNRIDVVLAGVAADFSGDTLELLGTNGTTVLATGTASPQGSNATNFDLAIQDFVVPAGGVYTIRVSSTQATNAEYTLRVTDTDTETGTVLESEPNDDQNAAAGLRRLNNDVDNINSVLGFLSAEQSEIRRLFAVDSSTDEIVEIDPDSGAEINRFSLPTPGAAGAAGLAFDGSSLFYASGEPGQRTLYEINPDTETVIDSDTFASIGLGEGIGSLGIVDGRLAALDGLTDQVMLVDTTTDQVIGSLDLLASGSSAASLFAFTGDGLTGADSRGSVFVWGLRLDSSLSVAIIEFDATDGSLLGSFDAPSDNGVPGLAFIGDELFALDSTNTVFKLDPDTGTTLDSYSLDVAPDTWITALGADAGAAAVGGDTFTVFLTAGQTITVSTETPLDSSTVGPVNSLDPRVVIFDPSGNEIGADSNSAGDGKNALLEVTAGADGLYRIQVQAESGEGEYLLNVDTGPPEFVLRITDVSPDPRNTAVGNIAISFTKAATGFDLEDLRLTRNGGGNLLPGGTSLSFDGTTYTLNGLAGLTGADGEYELSVSDTGAPIQAAGESLAAADVERWTMDTVAPVLTVNTLSTGDGSPQLTGTVDDASLSVDVTVNGSMYQANVAGNGVWTVPAGTIAPDLAVGVYDVSASATDAAGNTGSDNTNNELTITGGGNPADLNGNGFVDFEDLTILLANWNQMASAADGNLVNPGTTPVNFEDLTVLLAAWGPAPAGAAGAAGANAIAADVAVTEMTISSVASSTSSARSDEDEVSQVQPSRRANRASARRNLRPAAVDVALGSGGQQDAFAWRARHSRSQGRRAGR